MHFVDWVGGGACQISINATHYCLHVLQLQWTSFCLRLQDETGICHYRPNALLVERTFNDWAYLLIITLCVCTPAFDYGPFNAYSSPSRPTISEGNPYLSRCPHNRCSICFAEALPRVLYVFPRSKSSESSLCHLLCSIVHTTTQ
jgi:hypothetical protein